MTVPSSVSPNDIVTYRIQALRLGVYAEGLVRLDEGSNTGCIGVETFGA